VLQDKTRIYQGMFCIMMPSLFFQQKPFLLCSEICMFVAHNCKPCIKVIGILLLRYLYLQAWEKWRGQVNKLECSSFWIQCGHQKTRGGLKNLLHIIMGNVKELTAATSHWLELFVSHFLYIRPFTVVSITYLHLLLFQFQYSYGFFSCQCLYYIP
jgi:hypothetical protein